MKKLKNICIGWTTKTALKEFGKWFENTDGNEYAFHEIFKIKSAALWSHKKRDITKVRITIEEL